MTLEEARLELAKLFPANDFCIELVVWTTRHDGGRVLIAPKWSLWLPVQHQRFDALTLRELIHMARGFVQAEVNLEHIRRIQEENVKDRLKAEEVSTQVAPIADPVEVFDANA